MAARGQVRDKFTGSTARAATAARESASSTASGLHLRPTARRLPQAIAMASCWNMMLAVAAASQCSKLVAAGLQLQAAVLA